MTKLFILYDGRAKSGDTDNAAVLCTARSEAEAIDDSCDFEDVDGIWFEYDVEGRTLVNEKKRLDIGNIWLL
jgi:signal transduction histidine kinase